MLSGRISGSVEPVLKAPKVGGTENRTIAQKKNERSSVTDEFR
jgi:hypothetical protein